MAASAPYARRTLAGGALATSIVNLMGTGDGSCQLSGATNWPTGSVGPFFVVVDRNLNTEEKIECSGTSGTTLTFQNRGADGTTAQIHQAGATIAICAGGQDLDEANQVVAAVLGQASAAKGDILAMLSAAGPNTLTRVALGATGTNLGVGGSGLPAYEVIPGRVLATPVVFTNAGTDPSIAINNGTMTKLDATNLITGNFTVPASGNYCVVLQGTIFMPTVGNGVFFGLVDSGGSTQRGASYAVAYQPSTNGTIPTQREIFVIGDTPAATRNLGFAAKANAASCTFHLDAGATYGPATMKVCAL